jgi:hypothetical protein
MATGIARTSEKSTGRSLQSRGNLPLRDMEKRPRTSAAYVQQTCKTPTLVEALNLLRFFSGQFAAEDVDESFDREFDE